MSSFISNDYSEPPTLVLIVPTVLCHATFFLLGVLTTGKANLGTLLLVPIFFDALGVIVYVTLDDSCDSAAAYAKSISMVSASIIKEGYVFMFGVRTSVFLYLRALCRVLPFQKKLC